MTEQIVQYIAVWSTYCDSLLCETETVIDVNMITGPWGQPRITNKLGSCSPLTTKVCWG